MPIILHKYGWSDPGLGMVWADTDNPHSCIELNEMRKRAVGRRSRSALCTYFGAMFLSGNKFALPAAALCMRCCTFYRRAEGQGDRAQAGDRALRAPPRIVWPTSRGEGDSSVFKVGNPSKLAFLVRNTSF